MGGIKPQASGFAGMPDSPLAFIKMRSEIARGKTCYPQISQIAQIRRKR